GDEIVAGNGVPSARVRSAQGSKAVRVGRTTTRRRDHVSGDGIEVLIELALAEISIAARYRVGVQVGEPAREVAVTLAEVGAGDYAKGPVAPVLDVARERRQACLDRRVGHEGTFLIVPVLAELGVELQALKVLLQDKVHHTRDRVGPVHRRGTTGDRKSTRLNSSHRTSSYAVFCLKKKTQPQDRLAQPDRRAA